jgi:hypothetical protein
MHLIPGNSFEGRGIGLQMLDAILQLPIFFVQPLDFLLYFPRLQLRAAHRQHSVSAENILKQNQRKAHNQKPICISAQERAHLIDEGVSLWEAFSFPSARKAYTRLPLY